MQAFVGNDGQQVMQPANFGIPDTYHPPSFNQDDVTSLNAHLSLEQGAGVPRIAPPQQHLLNTNNGPTNALQHRATPITYTAPLNQPVLHNEQRRTGSYDIPAEAVTFFPQRLVHTYLRRDVHDNDPRTRGSHIPASHEGLHTYIGQSDPHLGHDSRHVWHDPRLAHERPAHYDGAYVRRIDHTRSPNVADGSVVSMSRAVSKESQILQRIYEALRPLYDPSASYNAAQRTSLSSHRGYPDPATRVHRPRSLSPRPIYREPSRTTYVQSTRPVSPSNSLPMQGDDSYLPNVAETALHDGPLTTEEPSRPRGRSRTPRLPRHDTLAVDARGHQSSSRKQHGDLRQIRNRVLHEANTGSASRSKKRCRSSSFDSRTTSDGGQEPDAVNADFQPEDSHPLPSELQTSGLLIDPWIDGKTHKEFTREDLDAASIIQVVPYHFTVHWAMRTKGSQKRGKYCAGDAEAEDSALGKCTRRKCLGVFRCPNWNRTPNPCMFLDRPNTKAKAFEEQRYHVCPLQSCGKSILEYVPCAVTQSYVIWKHGATFDQSGPHLHPRPSVLKHLTPTERTTLHNVLSVNPKLKGSALRSGGPNMVGPVPNVRKISSALGNLGRIAYEVQKFRNSATKGMSATEKVFFHFTDLQKSHPGIIRQSSLGPNPIHITIQSDFMRRLSFQPEPDFTKSNNGLVTDAAMKFFRNGKLMVVVITSTFDPDTAKWQAVCMSVIAGQTTEHYAVHFFTVFGGIHERCVHLHIEFIDDFLAMVSLFVQTSLHFKI